MANPSRKPVIGKAGVLAFIHAEIAAGKPFPSQQCIAEHFGWRSYSAGDALMALAAAGEIRVVSRRPSRRGFRYTFELVEGR